MNIRIATTLSNRGHRVVAMALAGSAALSAACASGGGSPPPTGVEAEALFSGLTGTWEVDKSTGTKSPGLQFQTIGEEVHLDVTDLGQARQIAHRMNDEALQRTMAWLGPILKVWLGRPSTLILRVDQDRLVYAPTPGRMVVMPMSGEWVPDPQRQSVRARVFWDGGRLAIERRVGSRGQVRSVLEIVDGRLQISRTVRVPRMTEPARPYVLMYDRDEGGRDRTARRSRFGAGASRPSSRSP